jgi:hypothetical protein
LFLGARLVSASTLFFSATIDTGEVAQFALDTSVPNTYDPALYPNNPVRGIYLGAVHDFSFEGMKIAVSDVAATPAETGINQPLAVFDVGPLFNLGSLSLELVFVDPSLVSPLPSDPAAYVQSFDPAFSILFPATPPARTHVDLVTSLAVSQVPEPSYGGMLAVIAVGIFGVRRGAKAIWKRKVG